jgi:hypothetical protein
MAEGRFLTGLTELTEFSKGKGRKVLDKIYKIRGQSRNAK